MYTGRCGERVVQAKEDNKQLINIKHFANGRIYCTSTVYIHMYIDRHGTIIFVGLSVIFTCMYMLLKITSTVDDQNEFNTKQGYSLTFHLL